MEKVLTLFSKYQDKTYKDFISRLTPSVKPENILGIRVPNIRAVLKSLSNDDCDLFIQDLPHRYYEENLLHGFIISKSKDFDIAITRLNEFLPYVDNWAVSDTMGPKVLSKNRDVLIKQINVWLNSKHTYTIRFAIWCLMRFFLEDFFDQKYLILVQKIEIDEYYVNIMRAWYYAEALTRNYDETLPFIETKKLDKWTHNKTIQKACESRRISENCKDYLKSLRIK